MNRCDSGTDSIVWMEEDVISAFCAVYSRDFILEYAAYFILN